MPDTAKAVALGRKLARTRTIDNHSTGFNADHFFRLLGSRNCNRRARQHLESLKALDSMLSSSEQPSSPGDRILQDVNHRYFRSIPQPRFPSKLEFCKVKNTQESAVAIQYEQSPNAMLMKRMCGIHRKVADQGRATLLAKAMDTHPVELRSILYSFVLTQVDNMCVEDMQLLDRLLSDARDDGNSTTLLGYLSGKTPVSKAALASNHMLVKLLNFVSRNHPALVPGS